MMESIDLRSRKRETCLHRVATAIKFGNTNSSIIGKFATTHVRKGCRERKILCYGSRRKPACRPASKLDYNIAKKENVICLLPRSANRNPEPATKSFTVLET